MDSSLTIAELVRNPGCVSRKIACAGGRELIFRLFTREDAEPLGRYFEGLSDATRRRYGPHAFTMDEAKRLCAELDYGKTMRFLAEVNGEIVAYFIVLVGFREPDEKHYSGYGLNLDGRRVCTLAPSVADAWQNSGLGSAMMGELIPLMRRLGFRWMVLFGGTLAVNERAIHFYRKHGFNQVGTFQTTVNNAPVDNLDMVLDLSGRKQP